MNDIKELQLLAEQRRKRLVEVVYRAKAGHIGGGMALAAKMNPQLYHTYVLMGDGEQGEGSIRSTIDFIK